MTYSELSSITLCAGPSLTLEDQDVTSMAKMHLDDQLIIDASARARDLLMVALALADEDMGWASWLDECWTQACRQQKTPSTDELREDPCWVLIATERDGVARFGWRIAGYRGETAFLAKPLWLLSDEERLVLLGWRLALPDNCAVRLREALNALGRALGAMLTDEPEPTGTASMEEISQALSVRLDAFRAGMRKD